jgi:hypothetical protein
MALAMAAARPGVPQPDPIPANPWRAFASPYLWLASTHLLLNLLVGVFAATFVIVSKALSVGLLFVALIGVVTWILSVYAMRWFSVLERGRHRLLLGLDVPEPRLPRLQGSWPRYVGAMLVSKVAWRQTAYYLLLLPWSVVTFSVVILLFAGPLTLMLMPVAYLAAPDGRPRTSACWVRSTAWAGRCSWPSSGWFSCTSSRWWWPGCARSTLPCAAASSVRTEPATSRSASTSWRTPAAVRSTPPTPSAGGSNATCTTAPSSDWCRSP